MQIQIWRVSLLIVAVGSTVFILSMTRTLASSGPSTATAAFSVTQLYGSSAATATIGDVRSGRPCPPLVCADRDSFTAAAAGVGARRPTRLEDGVNNATTTTRRCSGPIVIVGTAGSGTRVVSDVLEHAGVFLGARRNCERDNAAFGRDVKPLLFAPTTTLSSSSSSSSSAAAASSVGGRENNASATTLLHAIGASPDYALDTLPAAVRDALAERVGAFARSLRAEASAWHGLGDSSSFSSSSSNGGGGGAGAGAPVQRGPIGGDELRTRLADTLTASRRCYGWKEPHAAWCVARAGGAALAAVPGARRDASPCAVRIDSECDGRRWMIIKK